MSDQLTFADVSPRTLVHTYDPETSRDGAARNALGKATNRRACLEAHSRCVGLCDDDVSRITGLDLIEARRRCTDLRNLGHLEWLCMNGKVAYGKTDLGRRARVSIITPAGQEALA